MRTARIKTILTWLALCAAAGVAQGAQGKRTMTPEELSRLTLGTPEQQRKAFPPHKVIGNIYSSAPRSRARFS